ncbi:hypothetical protein SAMN05444166_5738 [Singulisphaera sp. GP187]|uniref:hypothetical protein n=1 Tax=Singulisphaera sp. GP187 TaxID=1882752 RepID=UPI0009299FC1|nr:hypothetical protein [Singulisphaera sp. GP187]SIO58595.1 hypothetical protein SAMN05444166_5738 [Singulisphaera sp. GP187]
MRLPIDEQLRERLRQLRELQLAECRAGRPQVVDEVFLNEEVVRLKSGGGHSAYLGLDGRAITVNDNEGFPPVVLEAPKDIASVVVRWAPEAGLAELVEVLPPKADGGAVCSLCDGTRYEELQGERWCCRRCCGLGWTNA